MIKHRPKSHSIRDMTSHYLADIVYGGNDGIVTTFAVISGAAGAKLSFITMLVLTVVNLLADGFSMAASNFLSIRSIADATGRSRGSIEPGYHALATFIAFIFFGAMPLLGYLADDLLRMDAFFLSTVVMCITMFSLGVLRSLVSVRRWYIAGLENLAVGVIASIVAYYCGKFMAYLVH